MSETKETFQKTFAWKDGDFEHVVTCTTKEQSEDMRNFMIVLEAFNKDCGAKLQAIDRKWMQNMKGVEVKEGKSG